MTRPRGARSRDGSTEPSLTAARAAANHDGAVVPMPGMTSVTDGDAPIKVYAGRMLWLARKTLSGS